MTSYYTAHISAEETQAAAEDEMMVDGNGRSGDEGEDVRTMVMRTVRAMVMRMVRAMAMRMVRVMVMRTVMMKVMRAVMMKAVRMRMMKETLNLLYLLMSIW